MYSSQKNRTASAALTWVSDYDDYDLRPLVPDPLLSFLPIVDASLRVRPISQSLEWRSSLSPRQVSCFVLMCITCVAI